MAVCRYGQFNRFEFKVNKYHIKYITFAKEYNQIVF